MSRFVWDKVGDRQFESGVDRGVLYLPDGSGVPWNGLTSVEDDLSDAAVTSYYFDGIKYLDTRYPGDYSATLRAFTFPEEFDRFEGLVEITNGMQLAHQPVRDTFGLCYRTRVGNDVDGIEHGYKLHILYNLSAAPDSRSYATVSADQAPSDFSWKITGVPVSVPGFRPTAHLVLDTRQMNRYLVADIEDILYGKDYVPSFEQGSSALEGGTPTSTSYDVVDGGILVDLVLLPNDGGTPVTAGTSLIDGGTVASSGTDIYDGGDPVFAGGTDTADGGQPIVLDDVYDGGTVDSSGGGSLDGGISNTPPGRLPSMADLMDLVIKWVLISVVDNGDGTWTATGPDDFVSLIDPTTFQINNAAMRFLSDDTYEITTTHGF